MNKPEDNAFAIATELNERVSKIAWLVSENVKYSSAVELDDMSAVNKYYVLLTNELAGIYQCRPELTDVQPKPVWHNIATIDGNVEKIAHMVANGQLKKDEEHIAQIKRFAIISGKENIDVSSSVADLIRQADTAISSFQRKVERHISNSFIDEDAVIQKYSFEYKANGTIMVNGILKLKKVHAGSLLDKLLEQASKHPNEMHMPSLGQTRRSLSTLVSDISTIGSIRLLFFPTVRQDKGVYFRPIVTRRTALSEGIDTNEIDELLSELS